MKTLISIFILVISGQIFAQSTWSKHFSAGEFTLSRAFYLSPSNELLLVGTAVPASLYPTLFLWRVNSFTGDSIDLERCSSANLCNDRTSIDQVIQDPEGNLITTGFMTFSPCNYLASVDTNLKIKWIKYLCTEEQIHYITSILEQKEGVLLAASYSSLGVTLQKRSFDGDLIWSRYIAGEDLDIRSPKLVQLENGEFLLFYVTSTSSRVPSGHLAKFDKNANLSWTKEVYWLTHDLEKAVDGHILTVESESIQSSSLSNRIKKLSAQTGEVIWQKDISFPGYFPQVIKADKFGGIYLAGTYRKIIDPVTNKYMFGLVKLDDFGNVKWNKFYESDQSEQPRQMIIGLDNSLFIQGNRESTGSLKTVIKKISLDGFLVKSMGPEKGEVNVSLTPNPASEWLNISIKNSNKQQVSYRIFSSTGQEVIRQTFNGESTKISLIGLSKGLYYLNLNTPKDSFGVFKFIKL